MKCPKTSDLRQKRQNLTSGTYSPWFVRESQSQTVNLEITTPKQYHFSLLYSLMRSDNSIPFALVILSESLAELIAALSALINLVRSHVLNVSPFSKTGGSGSGGPKAFTSSLKTGCTLYVRWVFGEISGCTLTGSIGTGAHYRSLFLDEQLENRHLRRQILAWPLCTPLQRVKNFPKQKQNIRLIFLVVERLYLRFISESIQAGLKGGAPSSWKTITTMSLPMCRFLSSCCWSVWL